MANPTSSEALEFLVKVAAMLQAGQLQALSISVTPLNGVTMGTAYVVPGASKLQLLANQLRMLDE